MARAVLDQLPHESGRSTSATPLASPTAPSPSPRSARYALECMDRLVDRDVKALVIACNSASRGDAARRPRALRRARRRGDPPGRAARGRRHAQRPGRRHLHPGARTRATPTPTRSPRPRTCTVTQPAVPAVRGVRRGRGDRRPGAAQRGPRVPRAGRGAGGRHADPRLHALPAADRRHLLRHGRGRHAGLLAPRRPPRTSTGCSRTPTRCARTTCRRPTHEFVTTGDPAEFERLARRFLGPEAVQAHLRDRWRSR